MKSGSAPLAVCLAVVGCAALPPEGSMARLKHDATMHVVQDCSRHPEHYGFSYTKEEYLTTARDLPGWVPDLSQYCWALARRSIR